MVSIRRLLSALLIILFLSASAYADTYMMFALKNKKATSFNQGEILYFIDLDSDSKITSSEQGSYCILKITNISSEDREKYVKTWLVGDNLVELRLWKIQWSWIQTNDLDSPGLKAGTYDFENDIKGNIVDKSSP